jgi:hypothetical protein
VRLAVFVSVSGLQSSVFPRMAQASARRPPLRRLINHTHFKHMKKSDFIHTLAFLCVGLFGLLFAIVSALAS